MLLSLRSLANNFNIGQSFFSLHLFGCYIFILDLHFTLRHKITILLLHKKKVSDC